MSPYLDNFVTDYLDDILIYSTNLQWHQDQVKNILVALTKYGLYLKPHKCEFHGQNVKYLWLIVGVEGIKMDQAKVESIKKWSTPERLRDVGAFLEFTIFYLRFIKGYFEIIKPMRLLTQKGRSFEWEKEQKQAFDGLKEAFTMAPLLARFDFECDVVVEIDASDDLSARILSQYNDQGILYLVAFFSKKHASAECN